MSSKQIFGYVVLHKETKERFPTNKGCYNSKAAAVGGFNRVTSGWGITYNEKLSHLHEVKFKDQDEYAVFPLVAHYD